MQIYNNGYFNHTIEAKELAVGLFKEDMPTSDSPGLVRCSGVVSDGVKLIPAPIEHIITTEETNTGYSPQLVITANNLWLISSSNIWRWNPIEEKWFMPMAIPTTDLPYHYMSWWNTIYATNGSTRLYSGPETNGEFRPLSKNELPTLAYAKVLCELNGVVYLGYRNNG